MKVDLTAKEKAELNVAVESNITRAFLQAKQNMKFEIGDVLVKHTARTDYTTKEVKWILEQISSDNKMPQRYVYVHEDDMGVGYIKELKVSTGGLGKEIYALSTFDYRFTKFTVDPEYAESTLLDGEYSIKEIHKRSLEKRKMCSKMNKKIGRKFKTLKQYEEFFGNLKVGDTFYSTGDYTGRHLYTYTVKSTKKVSINSNDLRNDYYASRWVIENKPLVDTDEVTILTYDYTSPWGGQRSSNSEFSFKINGGAVWYLQQPAKEEKS